MNPEAPGVAVHVRDEERGIDPVEVLGRDDDRCELREREVRAVRDPRGRLRRGEDALHGRALAIEQHSPDRAGCDRRERQAAAANEERTAGPVGHRCGDTDALDPRRRRRQAEQSIERRGSHGQLRQPGQGSQRGLDGRVPKAGDHAEDDEPAEDSRRGPRTSPGEDAQPGADRQGRAEDEDLERQLVGGPEERDDDLLRARGLEIDDEASDREDRRGDPDHRAGQELAGRERRPGRDGAGERGCAPGRADRTLPARPSEGSLMSSPWDPGMTRS